MWSQILIPFEFLYRGGLRGRRLLYRAGLFVSRRLPVPVVSVGNLTLGGTGKTPVTMALARESRRRGYRPCVLTRGYGGSAGPGARAVSDGTEILMDAAEAGDEARLMAEGLEGVPVVRAAARFLGGEFAIRHYGSDLMVLDDGFQHWELARDVDILLVDPAFPTAGGRCIPAGRLREPVRAASRADVILAVGEGGRGEVAAAMNLPSTMPMFGARVTVQGYRQRRCEPVRPPGELRGVKVLAFCGIARPERFLQSVEGLGAHVVGWKTFRDHHRFSPADEELLARLARDAGAEMILTTEKDAVRLGSSFFGTLVTTVDCEPAFFDFVFGRIAAKRETYCGRD